MHFLVREIQMQADNIHSMHNMEYANYNAKLTPKPDLVISPRFSFRLI